LLKLIERHRSTIRRSFKFENAWLEKEDLDIVVIEGWNIGVKGGEVLDIIQNCTKELEKWGTSIRLRFKKDIDDCRKDMEML
jgi:pantothenate kinase-related protein Tda10